MTDDRASPVAAAAPLSDRFLIAFAQVEEGLKRVLGMPSKESFRWMLRQAAKRNAVVQAVEEDLLELADLRNAIVHDRGGGYVLAEPHLSTVERLERIVELITDPPRIDKAMSRPVVTCGPDDSMASAATRMAKGDFSRMPVYEEPQGLIGLLTANAIARWLGTRLTAPQAALDDPVSTVLAHGDGAHRFELIARDRLVADVLGLFTTATQQGRRLEAVLITATGAPTEPLLGIVTIQDLPRLYLLVEP